MRKAFKCGVVFAIALLGSAGVAASAQAVVWSPDNSLVVGNADDPMLWYEDGAIVCDLGTLVGATGNDSPLIDNAGMDFAGPCTAGAFDATVDCGDGGSTADLIAETNDPPGGTGAFDLNDDFLCVVSIPGVCSIAFDGPANGEFILDEGNGILSVEVDDLSATRSGSSLCGPMSGTGRLTAAYTWSASIDP
jgi:hypothetical protein